MCYKPPGINTVFASLPFLVSKASHLLATPNRKIPLLGETIEVKNFKSPYIGMSY